MENQVIIRKAKRSDAKEILELVHQVFEESPHFPNSPGEFDITVEQEEEFIEAISLFLVATVNDKLVGSLTLDSGKYQKASHTATLGITLLNAYTGMGIGSNMLKETIDWCKNNEIEKINLEVFENNQRAIHVYKKLGFIVEGRRNREFKVSDRYIDNILMAKFL